MNHHAHTRTLITVAVAALVLVGCSSSTKTAPTTTTQPLTTISSTSTAPTTSAPSSTSAPTTQVSTTTVTPTATAPPETIVAPATSETSLAATTVSAPSTGGPAASEDWTAVLQHLLTLRHDINTDPDPARAGEIYARGTERGSIFENQLANKQAAGQRTVNQDPLEVRSVEVASVVPANSQGIEIANLRAVLYQGPNLGQIVDAAGEVVFNLETDTPLPPDGLLNVRYSLVRFSGGPWLISDEAGL